MSPRRSTVRTRSEYAQAYPPSLVREKHKFSDRCLKGFRQAGAGRGRFRLGDVSTAVLEEVRRQQPETGSQRTGASKDLETGKRRIPEAPALRTELDLRGPSGAPATWCSLLPSSWGDVGETKSCLGVIWEPFPRWAHRFQNCP